MDMAQLCAHHNLNLQPIPQLQSTVKEKWSDLKKEFMINEFDDDFNALRIAGLGMVVIMAAQGIGMMLGPSEPSQFSGPLGSSMISMTDAMIGLMSPALTLVGAACLVLGLVRWFSNSYKDPSDAAKMIFEHHWSAMTEEQKQLLRDDSNFQDDQTQLLMKEKEPSSSSHEVVIEDEHLRPDLEEVITGNKSDKRPINI